MSPARRFHAATSRHALMAVGIALAAPLIAPTPAVAQSGVTVLINQAQYWQNKGRGDLASQAWRRVLILDPGNAMAHRALNGGAPAPTPAPVRAPAPVAPAFRPATTPFQAETHRRWHEAPVAPPHGDVAAGTVQHHRRVVPDAAPAPQSADATPRAPRPYVKSAADIAGEARLEGFKDLQGDDLEAATHAFQTALARNKHDGDALGGLGLVALKQSNFAQAQTLLTQAGAGGNAAKWREALDTATFFAGLQLAQDALARGQLADAQAKAQALIHSGYAKPEPAVELLADVYSRQGHYAEAADLYRQAGQGDSAAAHDAQARVARANALGAEARGDDLGAEQAFQQGLALDQQDPWIRYEFARFMIKRGRAGEAEALIAALSGSANPEAIYAAAMLNSDLGRGTVAQRLMDRVPANGLTPPMQTFVIGLKIDAAIQRAQMLAAQGQKGEAIAALRQLAGTPGLAAGKLAGIANALADLGDNAGAAGLAQQALAGQVTDLGSYEAILHVAARAGRTDLAQAALGRANQLAVGDANGQHQVAEMAASAAAVEADRLRLAGRYAQAFDVLQTAWAGAPDSSDLLSSLARLYQSGRMYARAAQTFEMILQRDPHNRDALSGLMESAQSAGDRSLSRQAEQQLLSGFPDSYETYLSAAHVEAARGNTSTAVHYYKQARALYTRDHGATDPGGNPFATGGFGAVADGGNPFSAAPQAPAAVNPFHLGNSTRLQTQPQAYQAPAAYDAQPAAAAYAAAPATAWQQQGQGMITPAVYNGPQGGFQQASTPAQATAPGGFVAQTFPGTGSYQAQSLDTPGSYQPPVQTAPQVNYQANYAAANPFGGAPAAAASPFAQTGDSAAMITDPVLAGIQHDIAQATQDNGLRYEGYANFRSRSGEEGLSKLDEVTATGKLSTGLGHGRVFAEATEVVIDSGRPTGSALQRFGGNATIEAQAIVNAKAAQLVNAATQRAQGVAVSGGYEDNTVHVEVGTTPIGMHNNQTKAVWRVELTPKISDTTRLQGWFERKPVSDSILSYAGVKDPVTGVKWGEVTRTGGGGGFSYNDTNGGAYATVAYNKYTGLNVQSNHNVEVNAGGYMQVMKSEVSKITAGVNVNFQKFANNQDEFTTGAGGYFSPQNMVAIAFPINYSLTKGNLEVKASATPGFQSFSQAQTNVYTTNNAAQAILNALKVDNTDVRNYYDSLSKTGFAVAASAEAWYRLGNNTKIGGSANYSTFGNYNEIRMMLGIRQAFGGTK